MKTENRTKRKINVATIAKRMNRILSAQKQQIIEQPVASTSSFGQTNYTTERGLQLHKNLHDFATQSDSESDIDSIEPAHLVLERPPEIVTVNRVPHRQRKPYFPEMFYKSPNDPARIAFYAGIRKRRTPYFPSAANEPTKRQQLPNESPALPLPSSNTENDEQDDIKPVKSIRIGLSRRRAIDANDIDHLNKKKSLRNVN